MQLIQVNIATNTAEIASNASSIGTLSVQVNNNSQDIEALQEGIFFSSSYSADYPATANRDPETGNMYMQATGVFTFSYATCNQIFLSKTDEQGNTRQFTAIQPGDSLVLNEVESANYGRYELISVDDAGDYVVLLVNNKDAQGSLLAGAKVAFQAFPASGGVTGDSYTKAESDAIDDAQDVNISANTTAIEANTIDIATKIDEAPIDGKEYARKDAEWTEVTGGGSTPTPEALVWENKLPDRTWDTKYTNTNNVPMYVMVSTACVSPSSTNFVELYIDDISVGRIGGRADSIQDTDTFLIPAGSTYEFKLDGGGVSFYKWNEARMPVAVGIGGGSGGGTPSSFARIVDEKPVGVGGGDSGVGIQQRALNKIVSDDDGIVTLSEDVNFTLQPGTYVIDYSAPVFQSDYTKIYLHSVYRQCNS